jgi:hypothetical protein
MYLTFPVLGFKGCFIAWRIIEPHREQANINHGQTLERLAQRGGLSPDELVAVLEDRKWHKMKLVDAQNTLNEIVKNS